uniref:Putative ecdysone-inducible caspase n=1 Tax=Corethrella appendiculata TaxID=1370023 RepID=U5EYG7_9DIPT
MNDIHRKQILENIDELIKRTTYRNLIESCLNKEILSAVMIRLIEEQPKELRHRLLFEKITRRGPKAFNILLDILRDSSIDAYKILNPGANNQIDVSLRQREYENVPMEKEDDIDTTRATTTYQPLKNIENTLDRDGNCFSNNSERIKTDEYIENTKHSHKTLIPYLGEPIHNKKQYEIIKSKIFAEHPKLSAYPMYSRNRGVLFLVNIIHFKSGEKKREGAEVDRDNLISIFRGLGFKIFYYEDIEFHVFQDLIQNLINSEYLKHPECFVFGMLTHGMYAHGVSKVEFYDGGLVDVEDILKSFNNTNCKMLLKRPKIFLFPICRGNASDYGTKLRSDKNTQRDGYVQNVSLPDLTNIGTYSDMLICYATVPGFQTHRDPLEGSWFIQSLCNIIEEHAHDTHIEDLMKMVCADVAEIRTDRNALQTAATENRGFNQVLYFNPGLYND